MLCGWFSDAFQKKMRPCGCSAEAVRRLCGCSADALRMLSEMGFGLADALGMLCGCSADAFPKPCFCPSGVESGKKIMLLRKCSVADLHILARSE